MHALFKKEKKRRRKKARMVGHFPRFPLRGPLSFIYRGAFNFHALVTLDDVSPLLDSITNYDRERRSRHSSIRARGDEHEGIRGKKEKINP